MMMRKPLQLVFITTAFSCTRRQRKERRVATAV